MKPIRSSVEHAEDRRINVTPLIDVVMVMIVFFLIVGKLAADERSTIDLPLAEGKSRLGETGTLVINVTSEGAVVLHGREIQPSELRLELVRAEHEHEGLRVQIRADRSLVYGAVAPVIQACRDAGIDALRLAAEGGAP